MILIGAAEMILVCKIYRLGRTGLVHRLQIFAVPPGELLVVLLSIGTSIRRLGPLDGDRWSSGGLRCSPTYSDWKLYKSVVFLGLHMSTPA